MRLLKNLKRGTRQAVISDKGGFAASFEPNSENLSRAKIWFYADDRYFRYVVELSREDAESLYTNLARWLGKESV